MVATLSGKRQYRLRKEQLLKFDATNGTHTLTNMDKTVEFIEDVRISPELYLKAFIAKLVQSVEVWLTSPNLNIPHSLKALLAIWPMVRLH